MYYDTAKLNSKKMEKMSVLRRNNFGRNDSRTRFAFLVKYRKKFYIKNIKKGQILK